MKQVKFPTLTWDLSFTSLIAVASTDPKTVLLVMIIQKHTLQYNHHDTILCLEKYYIKEEFWMCSPGKEMFSFNHEANER